MLKIPKLNNKNSRINNGKKKIFTFQVLFLLCLVLFGISIHQNTQAAVSYFSPSSGNFTVGNIFTINIVVNTESVAINNAEAVINFPKDLLEIISLNKSGSIFSLWVEEPTFSNSAGTLSFNGGLPTPGFNGTAGKIIGAVFRVKKAGSASLIFSSAAVRANDGYGTNVFKTGVQAIFNLISEEGPAVLEEKTAPIQVVGKVPEVPAISSITHADSNEWYSNKNPQFSWTLPPDVNGVSLFLSKSPTSNPGPVSDGLLSSKSYQDIEDGIWYFHLKFRNSVGWGPITHFRFQIDTRSPEPFSIEFVHGKEIIDPSPIIAFNTTDNLSGINYYKVKIGSGDFFEVDPNLILSNPYALPPQDPGKNTVVAQAYDKAGNITTAVEEFEILALEAPKIIRYQENIAEGDLLEIGGKTYPDSDVDLFLFQENKKIAEQRVKSNWLGDFTFILSKKLEDGVYEIQAQVTNNRGAKSLLSEKITVMVEKLAIFRVGDLAINLLAVIIPLVALIFAFIFIIWYGWYKLSTLRRKIKKEVREAESALHKAFDLLKEDVSDQVEILEKIRTKRELTKEEGKIIRQLRKDLNDAEKFVKKEIGDIEKEVK